MCFKSGVGYIEWIYIFLIFQIVVLFFENVGIVDYKYEQVRIVKGILKIGFFLQVVFY